MHSCSTLLQITFQDLQKLHRLLLCYIVPTLEGLTRELDLITGIALPYRDNIAVRVNHPFAAPYDLQGRDRQLFAGLEIGTIVLEVDRGGGAIVLACLRSH